MVRLAGIEPATLGLEGRCSIQLSYRRGKGLRYTGLDLGGPGSNSGRIRSGGRGRDEPLHRLPQMVRREVAVALDHRQGPPSAKRLDRAQINPRHHEPLDPSTLEDEDGRLYCRVRRGAFRARFGRLALQQLGAHMGEGDGSLHLHLGGASYPIRSSPRG